MGQKHTPFTSLSRRKRRAKALRVKNLIYRERDRLGGIFFDECDQDVALASGHWTWSDILFLSHDPALFWNAEIVTANVAFADAVEDIAFNEALSKLDAAEKDDLMHVDFIPDVSSQGKTWLRKPQRHYPQFDGLTFHDFVDKRALEITRDNPPAIYCGYRILPGYAFGVGLQMVVDADRLNRAVIETAITDFRARGERHWMSDVPAHVCYSGHPVYTSLKMKE